MADALAALDHLRSLEEMTSDVGVVGFCFGGTLAYFVAAAGDPAAAVSYYGAGIVDFLDATSSIACPLVFHFGTADEFIPNDQVDTIEAAFAGRDEVALHRYPSGHAFDNHLAPQFSDPPVAADAWAARPPSWPIISPADDVDPPRADTIVARRTQRHPSLRAGRSCSVAATCPHISVGTCPQTRPRLRTSRNNGLLRRAAGRSPPVAGIRCSGTCAGVVPGLGTRPDGSVRQGCRCVRQATIVSQPDRGRPDRGR